MDDGHPHRPMATYLTLTTTFNVAAWAVSSVLGRRRRASLADVALLGTATHEVSRIVTKERVTQTIRAPFVDKNADGREEPRPEGPRRAIGELVTCPYCTAPWVALGLTTLFFVAPNATRGFCTVMSIAAVSDFLSRGYAVVRTKSEELEERKRATEAFGEAVARS